MCRLRNLGLPAAAVSLDREHETKPHITQVTTDELLVPYVEETGALVSLLVWLAFGAIAVVPAFEDLTWQTVLYAVLSLTVIRMAPVALALAGRKLGRTAVAFVGWFGPRGLASVVFALLALEDRQVGRACGLRDRLHRAAQRGGARPDRQPARAPLRAASRHHPRPA